MPSDNPNISRLLSDFSLSFSEPQLALINEQQPSEQAILTAYIAAGEVGLDSSAIAAWLLQNAQIDEIKQLFGQNVATIVEGIHRVEQLYTKQTSFETENFRKLLMSLAEDVRVVLLIIAQRVALMRDLNKRLSEKADFSSAENIARETSFLYAPLAHRLGLYAIKTELEDLSLKFTNYDTYKHIATALHQTKQSRDKYIADFIEPLQKRLKAENLTFHIKGRTKSIHSIYNKMQKQQCGIEKIFDLFAIRIILETTEDKEKAQCWQVYSIIADMYQPNPSRMRDWLTIPKSNGYESLHTTVLGPDNKWVEVQIRSSRMDEVAEKGVAAHWKYKGIKSEAEMDSFLKGVREMLENPELDNKDAINDFRLNLYDQEVFVFTPHGDLFKLPQGATVLDFAFAIHSGLGCKCVGGIIGGKNVPIRQKLRNGDQVEILTSNTQKPNNSWLEFVKTSKARNKIRQALKELEFKNSAEGRELLERRLKNWKLDYDESRISRLALKMGYKSVSDFYQSVATGAVDLLKIRDAYEEMDAETAHSNVQSAENYELIKPVEKGKNDVLVIDNNLKGVDFQMAKCCNPIYGDDIFGFVSINRGIRIHRSDCPNAREMRERFPYRVIEAKWSGTPVGSTYPLTLQVIGNDDIGIVTNMTSIISKENGVMLRTISIDSHDGLFNGHLTLMIENKQIAEQIMKKLSTVKGIKQIIRL
ncbi:MAG: bifunctional (p)ppGpp synthetase/guanosine-3',5'-bis(diphosphate) 3'-pyrophosphohydrolase [Paludibacteraceae bacterium]|nr:bifunctional (p)ppGpp synthetase/guanosine-3',5'-bis(diphosphate) 3'-pyrophosphohydrolase [Paludibacteraceae bacterium]